MPIPLAALALAPVVTQAGLGIASLIEGGASRRESQRHLADYKKQDAAIPLYDPNVLALQGQTERRRKAFEAGADPLTSFNIRNIRQTGAQTQENALRAGARGPSDLLQVQAQTNEGIAGASALASRRADNAFAMEGDLTNAMADRVYRRQMSNTQLAWNQYARSREDANRQRQAGLGMLLGIGAQVGSMGSGAPKVADAGGAGTPASSFNANSFGSYSSPQNYGFNYQPPSPNYGFNY